MVSDIFEEFLGWFRFDDVHRKMRNVFIQGELYRKTKDANGKEFKAYPQIINVRKTQNYDEIDFRLPMGVDPERVTEKWYVFEQYFSQAVELTVNNNNNFYRVRHFKNPLNSAYAYDFQEIEPYLKGKKLPIVIGKDSMGNYVIFDLAKAPTILVGGIMGSGKSVFLRTVLTTLILWQKKKKLNIQLILGDLKRTEFHLFRNIDCVKDVIVTPDELKVELKNLRKEVDRRGDLLDKHGVAHIDEYNSMAEKKEPYILLCIDEIAMISKDTKCMDDLVILVALGRALGLYVICSMQRPCAETLDTRIRSNLDVKVAFRVRDKSNSNLILGQGAKEDASKLERSGLCYVAMPDKTKLIQVAYLDMSDFQVIDGKLRHRTGKELPILEGEPVKMGAKDLLAPFKRQVHEKTEIEKSPQQMLKGYLKEGDINVKPR